MATTLWELAGDGWSEHRHGGTAVDAGALTLAAGEAEGAFEARLPEGLPVDRLVPSLNPELLPAGAVVRVRLRARVDGDWTPWAPLGVYGSGEGVPRSEVGHDPARIEVQVDTAVLPAPATRVELRLELVRARDGAAPRVRRAALVAWRAGSSAPSQGALDQDAPSRARACEVDVPERSQAVEDPEIASRICSPTSLSMVLARWGHVLPTAEVARGVYDHGAKLYGNWSFNVAFAARLGLEATVARLERFGPLEDELAAGRPVVLSHRYRKGEVQGAAVSQTDGHLIVARGLTEAGDVIVNDPAADPRDGEPIRRVYRRSDLARSWLGNASGVCYLIRG